MDYIITNRGKEYDQLVATIKAVERITIDIETTGLNPYKDSEICGVAFSFPGLPDRYYVSVRHEPHIIDGYDEKNRPIIKAVDPTPYNLPINDFRVLLGIIHPTKIQRGYNYKFDLAFLRKDGMRLPENIEDPMLMAYLCNENEKNYKLKDLSVKYFGEGANKEQQALYDRLSQMGFKIYQMYKLFPREVAPYALDDVLLTDKLYDFYIQHIKVWKLEEMMKDYFEYEIIVHMMEYKGMPVDPNRLKRYKLEAYFNAKDLKKQIEQNAGYAINLRSSKQVCAWLNTHSMALATLENILATTNDENKKKNIKLLLEYKSWDKVYSTYYKRFEELMDADFVIHPSFQIVGTVSGRLSCRTPNLQQLPRRNKSKGGIDMYDIYKVKDVFVARPGYIMLSSDLSQAELRLGASRAGVKAMKDKIIRGVDIHTETAHQIGIPRSQAKTLNFSIFYGMGAQAMSDKLGISLTEAQSTLKKYHQLHPEIRSYARELEARARAHGYIRMFTGRVKRFPRKEDCHKAISSDIQGGVAELMRIAMTRLHRAGLTQYLSNQIHDDIILEIPIDKADEVAEIVGRELTDFEFVLGPVPMKTDTKLGPSWGEMISYEEYKQTRTSD